MPRTPSKRKYPAAAAAVALCLHALAVASCESSSSPTSPTSTTSASVIERWSGTLPIGGSVSYAFSVSQAGTVNVSLENVGGTYVPETVMVGLAVGNPSRSTCNAGTATTVQVGGTSLVSTTQSPGTYCAVLSDIGNLYGDAQFTIAIEHP